MRIFFTWIMFKRNSKRVFHEKNRNFMNFQKNLYKHHFCLVVLGSRPLTLSVDFADWFIYWFICCISRSCYTFAICICLSLDICLVPSAQPVYMWYISYTWSSSYRVLTSLSHHYSIVHPYIGSSVRPDEIHSWFRLSSIHLSTSVTIPMVRS